MPRAGVPDFVDFNARDLCARSCATPSAEAPPSGPPASEPQGAAGSKIQFAEEDDGPRWVATAEALFLQRSAAGNQQLLYDPGASVELLNASNLAFSSNAGPRLTLRREDPNGLGLELSYFGIDGWQSSANFPNSAFAYGIGYLAIDKALVMPVSDARFLDTSRIYSGEINLRDAWNDWLTPLAGVRWIEFEDRYAVNGTGYQFSAPLLCRPRAGP